jgi:hypothetical protein
MGDPDPQVARENSPNSIRALYGLSRKQNAVMGSSDTHNAELQIASLFASSPPFPAAELPDVSDLHSGNYRGSTHRRTSHSEDGYARSNHSSTGKQPNAKHKVIFRARPVPKTHDVPDILPRTTRAAALRAGVVVEKTPTTPRAPISKARLAMTFANVPGHKRAETIAVASTAPPVVAPRMTRAAALRLGQPDPEPARRRPSSVVVGKARAPDPATFDGVPGHKRRETISVASVKAPVLAPRINKSAALRVAKDTAPPSSYMCKQPRLCSLFCIFLLTPPPVLVRTSTTPKAPGLARANSQSSMNRSRPTSQNAFDRPRPASAVLRRPSPHRASTSASVLRASSQTPTPLDRTTESPEADSPPAPPRPRPASVNAPKIAPRTNRSALLRAAKMGAGASPAKGPKSGSSSRALVH